MSDIIGKRGKHIVIVSVWFLRIFVGGIFLYSGFVKSVDPWGFIFKLEEYFALAHIVLPRSITLLLALGCSIFEFVSGLILSIGSYRRLMPIAMLLFMAVMLPLTAYLYLYDPITDCGCFGDAIVLTNGQTFFKNIILTLAVIVLLIFNIRVKGLLSVRLGWAVGGIGFLYSLAIGLVGYNIQPFLDFRPYPEGGVLISDDISEQNVVFRYTDGNVVRDFAADSLPEDDAWKFVERIDKDNDTGADLALYDSDSEDVLPLILENNQNGFFLLVIPEPIRADISGTFYVNELAEICKQKNIGFYCAIAADMAGVEIWKDLSLADYPIFTGEDTSLKEFARGTMALAYVRGGKIVWKRTVSSLSSERLVEVRDLDENKFPTELTFDLAPLFRDITFGFIILLVSIFGIQQFLRSRIRHKRQV